MGRQWISPAGNVYASTIVRLGSTDPAASTLAFVAVLAVYKTLEKFAPDVAFQIKWPNDILSGAGAKLSGILLERSGDAVVIGAGINLAHYPEGQERPVTSLTDLGSKPPEPQVFVECLADIFASLLQQWRSQDIESILVEWQQYAHPASTALQVNLPDGQSIWGEYDGLSDDGALMLRLADGSIRAIHAADVFLV